MTKRKIMNQRMELQRKHGKMQQFYMRLTQKKKHTQIKQADFHIDRREATNMSWSCMTMIPTLSWSQH